MGGGSSGVLKRQDIRAVSDGGGISELETMVIIKVSPFTPCASLLLPLSLFLLTVSTYLTYRSASRGAEEG